MNDSQEKEPLEQKAEGYRRIGWLTTVQVLLSVGAGVSGVLSYLAADSQLQDAQISPPTIGDEEGWMGRTGGNDAKPSVLARFVFNNPPEIHMGEEVSIDATASMNTPFQQLAGHIDGLGALSRGEMPATAKMKARLTGPDHLNIKMATADVQTVDDGITRWSWLLRPEKEGNHSIVLAFDTLEGDDKSLRSVTVKKAKIRVTVTTGAMLMGFLNENTILVTLALAAIAGLWAIRGSLARWAKATGP